MLNSNTIHEILLLESVALIFLKIFHICDIYAWQNYNVLFKILLESGWCNQTERIKNLVYNNKKVTLGKVFLCLRINDVPICDENTLREWTTMAEDSKERSMFSIYFPKQTAKVIKRRLLNLSKEFVCFKTYTRQR